MDRPPHQRIADDLRRRVRSREWTVGQLLPSFRDLQAHYGVGLGAIRLAMEQLRSEGLIEGVQRARLWAAYPPAVRTLTSPDAEWPHGQRG
ncbi:winged helix-turn-helix domain-containing protein [Streptomyces sp. NPDC020096]